MTGVVRLAATGPVAPIDGDVLAAQHRSPAALTKASAGLGAHATSGARETMDEDSQATALATSSGQKRIALFLNDTWNVIGNNTNVWRLYSLCAERGAKNCLSFATTLRVSGTTYGEKSAVGCSARGSTPSSLTRTNAWWRTTSPETRSSSSASAGAPMQLEASLD